MKFSVRIVGIKTLNQSMEIVIISRFHSIETFENGDKVSLSVKVGAYFWNQMIDKITYTDQSFRLTFNTKTGNLYLIQGRKTRNITYGTISKRFTYLIYDMLAKHQEKAEEFVSICFQKRGVIYKSVNDFKEYNSFRFWDAMLYAKYP